MDEHALKLFEQAIDQPNDTRDEWLISQCGDDHRLLNRVRRLLKADASTGRLLATGGGINSAIESPPEEIGPYRILDTLGHGGMGAVFKAERADGAYQRTVAIKLIGSTLLSDESRARFVNERQILADMQHPNVAQLLDGGTDDGQPYLVMEYVEGNTFAYDPKRSVRDTLGAFLKVCDAVGHAHNNLILHRDIKPDNVLLSSDGEPKLLDFGIAKINQALASTKALDLTGTSAAPMTVNYAAPERFAGEPATIATDIYSLGVYLYELVGGRRPFSLAYKTLPEAYKYLTTEPLEPLASGSEDLDLIVATCLHTDPRRRYASVSSLAEDIRRFLKDRPITARGDDWRYTLGRFVKRNRAAVAFAASGLLLLVAALVYSLWQTNIANQEKANAQAIAGFLESMLSASDPRSGNPLGPDATLSELLDLAERYVADEFVDRGSLQVRVYGILAQVHSALGNNQRVEQVVGLAEAAVSEYQLSDPELEFLLAYSRALVAKDVGPLSEADANCDRALTLLESLPDLPVSDRISALVYCANVKYNFGKPAEAKVLAARADAWVTSAQRQLPRHKLPQFLADLANIYSGLGDAPGMETYLDRAVEVARSLGEDGLATLSYLYLAKSLRPNQVGEVETSLRFTQLAYDTANQSAMSRNGNSYAFTLIYHADRLIDAGWLDEADRVFQPVREMLFSDGAEVNSNSSIAHFTEYKLAYRQEDYPRAEIHLLTSQAIRKATGQSYNQWFAATDHALGQVYLKMGRVPEAQELLKRSYDFYLDLFGPEHARVQRYLEDYEAALEMQSASP